MDGRQIRLVEKVVFWFYLIVGTATVIALIWHFVQTSQ
jgi:hypothetical protein